MGVDPEELSRLREHWRGFAREDGLAYARVGLDRTDAAAFYADGVQDVADVLEFVGRDVERGRALDVGCGPGRHLGALAGEFESVDGVDIAPEMLALARERGLPSNVGLTQTSGADLPFPDGTFDLVMSLLVLQHIPDHRILLANLREIRRVMKATGRAVLQFDSRSPSAAVAIVQVLPDALLPRIRRRYVRRYRRPAHVVDALLRDADLTILRESGRGTATHHLALRRTI